MVWYGGGGGGGGGAGQHTSTQLIVLFSSPTYLWHTGLETLGIVGVEAHIHRFCSGMDFSFTVLKHQCLLLQRIGCNFVFLQKEVLWLQLSTL